MGPLIAKNARETRELFSHSIASAPPSYYPFPAIDEKSARLRLRLLVNDQFKQTAAITEQKNSAATAATATPAPSSSSFAVPLSKKRSRDVFIEDAIDNESTEIIQPKPPTSNEELLNKMSIERRSAPSASNSNALIAYPSSSSSSIPSSSTPSSTALMSPTEMDARMQLIMKHRSEITRKPKWHAPWKLMRVISGHAGWVRTIAVDHSNQWFASGSVDRTIKLWELASGRLMLTLTGHVSTVRALAISSRHPYMFSAGEDRSVKNWDLEQNKVIRHYHGHLSAVYSIALHPTLDLLFTGGRDSTVRVWDIRSKNEVGVLAGHKDAVGSVVCQGSEPQVISGSHDSTVRCWDLAKMQPKIILTHHQKAVRSLLIHPTEYTFASSSSDNIKVWKCPEATFLRNIAGHNAIINATAINEDDVFVSGGDNGSVRLWDWSTGHCFQSFQTIPQPGSLESESGIMAMSFDQSGSRLITGEVDKSIKVYKEDPHASEETHPLNWKPERRKGPIH